MTAIVDYGAGNLHSVENALKYIGEKSIITKDKHELISADRIILPGVGAFPKAMEMLNSTGLVEIIKQQSTDKPLLGICLGMQMLFEYSTEFAKTDGLCLIDGYIDRIKADYKIPHMGYNELERNVDSVMLKGIKNKSCVYFVHSYMAYTNDENVSAYCDYGVKVPALVRKGNVYGAQFHPEKSGEIGIEMLRNFVSI